jgi:hypothetical protein
MQDKNNLIRHSKFQDSAPTPPNVQQRITPPAVPPVVPQAAPPPNPNPTTTARIADPVAALSQWYKDKWNDELKILSADPRTGIITIEDFAHWRKGTGTHRERLKAADAELKRFGYELVEGWGEKLQLKPVAGSNPPLVTTASRSFADLEQAYGKKFGGDTLKLVEIQSPGSKPVFIIEDVGSWGKKGGTHRTRLVAAGEFLAKHGFRVLEPENEGAYLKLEYIGAK